MDLTPEKYSTVSRAAQIVIADESIVFSKSIFKICAFLMTVSSVNFITSPLWREIKDLPLIVWVPFDYEALCLECFPKDVCLYRHYICV
jgi:hypothetical protein